MLDPKNHLEFVSVQDHAQAEILPCKSECPRKQEQPKTSLHADNE